MRKINLDQKISSLQRECRERGIPVMIVFEGLGAAGKGTMINRLLKGLDPRGVKVHTIGKENEEEQYHPFLWRFWTKLPGRGEIAVFDRSWYRRVSVDYFGGEVSGSQLKDAYKTIRNFEEQLINDGIVLIKFFLYISKKEQKKRFKKLRSKKSTAWKVTGGDLKRLKHYQEYMSVNKEMIIRTERDHAPWNQVDGTDNKFATIKILSAVVECLTERLASENAKKRQKVTLEPDAFTAESILGQADLTKQIKKETYNQDLKRLQKKLSSLHPKLYRKRVPVILVFEGWDASGKGGAIKRMTAALDPRGYEVHPISAPDETEKKHHYLWRFWKTIPKDGHIGIYDRSWYGRVLVERVEGFCSEEEWKRSYGEILEMERQLHTSGAIILKFWMHIDQEEQLKRFRSREENPDKEWKITEEDWRNREKWKNYECAAEEMLRKTSTEYAPWIVVEGNCKRYARIKVLKTVEKYMEKGLK